MLNKMSITLGKMHRGQRGISGLETAIILIAFVTVASVLAYSVLSAGIYSAERAKETVYKGLQQAQSTLEIKGSVLGLSSSNSTNLSSIQFTMALTIPDQKVDKNALVFNYFDKDQHLEGINPTSFNLSAGSTERGAVDFIENDEQFLVVIPLTGVNCTAYDVFTVQIIPPTGASLTVRRIVPGNVLAVNNLH